MHTLIVKHNAAVVTRIPLTSAAASIGRNPSNTVVIASPTCSPFHATIEGEVVTDLGSSTGTYVNGLRVKRATIHPGDRITIGDHVLEIRVDEATKEILDVRSGRPSASSPRTRGFARADTTPPVPLRQASGGKAPVLIALSGILDARSDVLLSRSPEAPVPPGAHVIFDFAGVASVTGDGWRLLVKRIKTFTSPGSIKFTHMNPGVQKGFRALGLGRFFSAS